MNTIRLEINPPAPSADPWLLENVTAEGKNGSYEIIAADFLASGGESQLYGAKRLSDGKMLLAKVYTTNMGGVRAGDERTAIRNSILEMKDPVSCGLLPLLDMLRIENSRENRADVDIIPFCESGSLGSASYDELRSKVIPRLMKALHYLHENDWVHRDVKPENIYVLDGNVVLGDFGTTVKVSKDRSVTNQTQGRRGTPGYTAREVRSGYSKIASDYFSLGCTIATLYNQGEHVYAEYLNNENENEGAFYNQLRQHGFPLNCPDHETDLQVLVDALTLDDEDSRAGYHDVMQWLNNPEGFEKKWRSCRQGVSPAFQMRFEERDYFSEKDLTEAFLQNWEEALNFFYESDMFVQYIKATRHPGCNTAESILRNPPTDKLEKDLCFAKFLHFFNKPYDHVNPPVYWQTHQYNSLSEIAAAIKRRKPAAVFEILNMLLSGFLSWKLEVSKPEDQRTPEDCKTLETVKGIEKYANEQPGLAMETFSLLLDSPAVQEERTTEQIIADVLLNKANRDIFYKLCVLYPAGSRGFQIPEDVFTAVFAPLILKGHSADMFELAKAFDKTPNQVERATIAYLTFEGICTAKGFVRRHFYEHGPYAHLYWLTKNIGLYEISSGAMRDTAARIRAVTCNDSTPIRSQLKDFTSLKSWHDEFYGNFQDSMLQTALGNMGGKTVKGKVLDAFYCTCSEELVNRHLLSTRIIPIGYLRTMGYLPGKHFVEMSVTQMLDIAASEVKNVSDASVKGALDRISGGLAYLFREYCTNTLYGGNVVQYAVDTVNNTRNGNSKLGKVIAKATSPAYFHLYLYNIIDAVLQRQLKKPSLRKWDELRSSCQNAFGQEYDRQLHSRVVSFDILARRCPNDYRPVWLALEEKTAGFKADGLLGRAGPLRSDKNDFDRAERQFDAAVRTIQSKKISQIGCSDFTRIIRCAETGQDAWEKLERAFNSYNRGLLSELNAAKAKAGADAAVLQSIWDNYTVSIEACKSTDFRSQISYWKGEKWEAEGLCRYCGGKLTLFGKCKNCGRRPSQE